MQSGKHRRMRTRIRVSSHAADVEHGDGRMPWSGRHMFDARWTHCIGSWAIYDASIGRQRKSKGEQMAAVPKLLRSLRCKRS